MQKKNLTVEQIEDLITSLKDGKETNNWKFGIELEYGGYNNWISFRDDPETLIETIKHDGSVAGDGTEYNLKPISFEDLKSNKKIIKALESFCYRVANKNCTLSKTAGMHIHFSWDKEFDTDEGRMMGRYLCDLANEIFSTTFNKYIRAASITAWPSLKITNPIEIIDWKEEGEDGLFKWKLEQIKKIYEAFQFIYSVSNREGTEGYGLGRGYTRGYSRHKTLELRCWRTTHDFREIIARVFIARFFLQYILRLGLYQENCLYDEIINMPTIWNMLNKAENKKLKSMYEYLAYNVHNKHKMGLPLHMLMAKIGTVEEQYVKEIKRRSDLYNKALIKETNGKKAKEVFETIIDLEDKGEENESRV